MKNSKALFTAILAVVFCFAGYNLWSYFQGQQDNKKLGQRESHELSLAKEKTRLADIATREKLATKKREQQEEKERQAQARRDKQKADRLLAQEKRNSEIAGQRERREAMTQAELESRFQTARTPRMIEGIPIETIEQIRSISARYIRDKPQEFLTKKFDETSFNNRYGKLLKKDTTFLMLFAAISQDTDHIQALLDIGMDINASNAGG